MEIHGYSILLERIDKFLEEQEKLAAKKLKELGLTLQDLKDLANNKTWH